MEDAALVALLRRRPKEVPQLRTRAEFQRFFRGVPRRRLAALLFEAFQELPPEERDAKVQKRLQLFGGAKDEGGGGGEGKGSG